MRRRIKAEAGYIPTEHAKKILRQGGLELSDEQVRIVMELLYLMANEAVAFYLKLPQK
ncbi:hypothetical protein KJK34_03600 [Flavobacterium sp. D11R37]|uniref:hypothetical protein n=1 Tax=Flavobacterium coralii TaxID=2838017 RepID=UPI001CA799CD|nr:hypothetical protein [Flavobacterium coralii]MBY8961830.1 hypothetical protein [Flavobacterium coralii]